MKILILHLSDMHFVNENNFTLANVNAIVNALQQSVISVNSVLIVISGDLANSGQKNEFMQVEQFLIDIKSEILNRYHKQVEDVQFVIVPGNHDVDLKNNNDLGKSGLEKLEKNGSYIQNFQSELNKQSQFFFMANLLIVLQLLNRSIKGLLHTVIRLYN